MAKKSKNNKANTNKQKSIVIPKKFLEKYLIKLDDASNIRGRRNQFQKIKPERADAVNLTLRVAHNLPENVNVDSKVAQLRIKDKWKNSFSNPANAYLDYKANKSYYNKRAKDYAAKKKKEEKFRANGIIADLITSNPRFIEESAAPMDNTIVNFNKPLEINDGKTIIIEPTSTEISTPKQQLASLSPKPLPETLGEKILTYAPTAIAAAPIAYMATSGGIVPLATSIAANPVSWAASAGLGYLGSEGVNSGVRLLSNNKYNSWGDMLGDTDTEKFVFELTNPGGWIGGIKGWNLGRGGDKAINTYRLGREMSNTPININTTEPVLNVGWGPKLTLLVVHKSSSPNELVTFNPRRWDVVNEGANPFGIWYLGKQGVPRTVQNGASVEKAAKAERARQLFEDRPFTHDGQLTLSKPIVTVGEVPDRSALSYTAELMGADGVIYNGVYDNGLNNNLVILSFKHPQLAAVPKFQSELDWSPESWFATRSDGKYTPEDVKILNSHIDEYLDIERNAKANGTWLQMSDGSTWQGDPRSWVLMQSQAYKDYMNGSLFPDRTFVHASPVKFGLFDYRYFGQNTDNGYYGKGFYFHPPTAYLLSINRFTHPNSYGDEIYNMAARINNPFFPKSMSDAFYNGNVHLFNREGAPEALNSFDSVLTLPPQFMFHEGLSATNPELIIKNINDVKSILGNNGNFSIFSDGFYYKNGGRINNGKD